MARASFFLVVFVILGGALVSAFSSGGNPMASSGGANRHGTITREGLTGLGFSDDFIQCLVDGNFDQDWDETNYIPGVGTVPSGNYKTGHHFDRDLPDPTGNDKTVHAGAFRDGYDNLYVSVQYVMGELEACHQDYKAYCNKLGRALHGLQDFFSHSNYIDLPPGEKAMLMDALTSTTDKPDSFLIPGNLPPGLKLAYFGEGGSDTYTHEENAHDDESDEGFSAAKTAAETATRRFMLNIKNHLMEGPVAFKWDNLIEYEKPWIREYVPKHTKENYKVSILDTQDGVIKTKAVAAFGRFKTSFPDFADVIKTEKLNVEIATEKGRKVVVGIDFGNDKLTGSDFAPLTDATLRVRTTKFIVEKLASAADPQPLFARLVGRGMLRIEGVGGGLNDLKAQAINTAIQSISSKTKKDVIPTTASMGFDLSKAADRMVRGRNAYSGGGVTVITNGLGLTHGCTSNAIAAYGSTPKTAYSPTAGFYAAPPTELGRKTIVFYQLKAQSKKGAATPAVLTKTNRVLVREDKPATAVMLGLKQGAMIRQSLSQPVTLGSKVFSK